MDEQGFWWKTELPNTFQSIDCFRNHRSYWFVEFLFSMQIISLQLFFIWEFQEPFNLTFQVLIGSADLTSIQRSSPVSSITKSEAFLNKTLFFLNGFSHISLLKFFEYLNLTTWQSIWKTNVLFNYLDFLHKPCSFTGNHSTSFWRCLVYF